MNGGAVAQTSAQRRFLVALETTRRIAPDLGSLGYTIEPLDRYGVYAVHKPVNAVSSPKGKTYEVDLANWTCECVMYQQSMAHGANECKHLRYVEMILVEAVRLVAGLIPAARPPARIREGVKRAEQQHDADSANVSHSELVDSKASPLNELDGY